MIRFDCDYLEGAHPAILQKMLDTNMDQTVGYGEDPYCAAAAEKIRKACDGKVFVAVSEVSKYAGGYGMVK